MKIQKFVFILLNFNNLHEITYFSLSIRDFHYILSEISTLSDVYFFLKYPTSSSRLSSGKVLSLMSLIVFAMTAFFCSFYSLISQQLPSTPSSTATLPCSTLSPLSHPMLNSQPTQCGFYVCCL